MSKALLMDDGYPPADLDDNEWDAISLSDWLEVYEFTPTPIVPMSATNEWYWAHDNAAAWPMVDLPDGMTVEEAKALAVEYAAAQDAAEAAARDEATDGEERYNPYHQKNGKFGYRPVGGLASPHAASNNPAAVAKQRVFKAKKVEPALTSYTGKLAKQHGGRQEGLPFRLKTEKSLARKIGNDVKAGKGQVTSQEVADRMFDVNRYTTIFPPEKYAGGAQATLDQMRADGHTLRVKNFWNNTDNPYQGINVQAIDPNGNPWELQFHTDISFDVKEHQSHALYEQLRVERNPARIAELDAQITEIFGTVPIPAGVRDVS